MPVPACTSGSYQAEASMPDPPLRAAGAGMRSTGAVCVGSLNCEPDVISLAIPLPYLSPS